MKTKREPETTTAEKVKVLVNVVLDRSGSMMTTRDGTISGYNEYLNGLRADQKTEYNVTLIQFDSPADGPELTVKYADKPLSEVPDLTASDYEPRGMTPLYDAIGECIRRVKAKGRAVITTIITDGQENSSKEFTRDTIKALITEKEQKEHWTFVFLGANIDSYEVGGSLGVASAATSNYAPGKERQMYARMASATVSRSALIGSKGLACAVKTDFLSDDDRLAMGDAMGGRQAAPPSFRPQVKTSTTIPRDRRPNWKTSNI